MKMTAHNQRVDYPVVEPREVKIKVHIYRLPRCKALLFSFYFRLKCGQLASIDSNFGTKNLLNIGGLRKLNDPMKKELNY